MTTTITDEEFCVYWERQVSLLCGVHCLNNLVQQPMFSEVDMSMVADQLQRQERSLLTDTTATTTVTSSSRATTEENPYVDDSGNFSVDVLLQCLSNVNLRCSLITSEEMVEVQQNPVEETGFICNLQSHWFALRKFPIHYPDDTKQARWLNLNSLLENGPETVSDFYLSAYLAQLQSDGYTIFVVRGDWPPLCLYAKDRLEGFGEWIPMQVIQAQKAESKRTGATNKANHNINESYAPSYLNEDDDLAAAINASLETGEVDEDDEDLKRAIAQSLSQ